MLACTPAKVMDIIYCKFFRLLLDFRDIWNPEMAGQEKARWVEIYTERLHQGPLAIFRFLHVSLNKDFCATILGEKKWTTTR